MAYSYVAEPMSFGSHAFPALCIGSPDDQCQSGQSGISGVPGTVTPTLLQPSFIFLQNHCISLWAISGVENKT